jgi:hypothetical protein
LNVLIVFFFGAFQFCFFRSRLIVSCLLACLAAEKKRLKLVEREQSLQTDLQHIDEEVKAERSNCAKSWKV